MPARSSIAQLPQELREELSLRLVRSGFGDYSELAQWLRQQGYQISRSAVHRYGQAMEAEFEEAMGDVKRAQELAKAYSAATADESQALTGAVAGMAQESLLRILIALRKAEADPGETARQMALVSRALADLGRLSMAQTKHALEIKRQAAQEMAGKIEAEGGPVTPERLREIMRETYGV